MPSIQSKSGGKISGCSFVISKPYFWLLLSTFTLSEQEDFIEEEEESLFEHHRIVADAKQRRGRTQKVSDTDKIVFICT